MPVKGGELSESNQQKYNVSKALISALVASKDFAKAKDQYDKLFDFLKKTAKISKAKIPEYKIEVDFAVMGQVQIGFSVEDVKRVVEVFEIRLPSLIRSEINFRSVIERYDFCAMATDILRKCWQGNFENVKNLLEFFIEKGISIESELSYNDMLFNATTKYFVDHEFIRALLETGRFEVNKYFVIQEKVIVSAFSMSKSLGNMQLVSVFLEFGADPNFIDKTINADEKLLQKVRSGELKGGASMEVPVVQRSQSFTDADFVIEKFYVNNLGQLVSRYNAGVVAALKSAASSENAIDEIIALFDQYLTYKSGAAQESLIVQSVQFGHALEMYILKYFWCSQKITKRDSKLLDEISNLISSIDDPEIRNKYQEFFVRLSSESKADLKSFQMEIIKDFLEFKVGKEFRIEMESAADRCEDFVWSSEDENTVPDEEEESLESDKTVQQNVDDWGQLVAEISDMVRFSEEDLDSGGVYDSGESDDEEEVDIEEIAPLNLAQAGIWSSSALGRVWSGFCSASGHFEVKTTGERELLRQSFGVEDDGGFFGDELDVADDSLEPGSLSEVEEDIGGFFGDMSGINDSLEKTVSLVGDDKDDFNALEE